MSSMAMDRPTGVQRPLTVVVLFGGWSSECEVSRASGRAVIQALRCLGHDVRELDPAAIDILTYPCAGVDAAFIALHGAFGEDGTVQSLLEDLHVPFTGSGPAASRLAMNKSASKARFAAQGLPTPPAQTVHVMDSLDSLMAKSDAVGYPLVVKPNAQGSSIGVNIVQGRAQLQAALTAAFQYDPLVILESYIDGLELTVGVWGHRPLPVIEIKPSGVFFDYRAKYLDDHTTYEFDINLPPGVIRGVESLAVSAVEALGCSGVSRVDLRLDSQQRPWLLEVNTVPGLTDHSLIPKAAARAGIDFPQLCEQLLLEKLQPTVVSPGNRAA